MSWEIEKQRQQYIDKKASFENVVLEITKLHQLLGLTGAGQVTQSEYQLRTKESGLAISVLNLVANPETIRQVQNYLFKTMDVVVGAMLENQKMIDLKAKADAERNITLQRQLSREYIDRMLKNLKALPDLISALSPMGASVMLTLRNDLEYETDASEFTKVLNEHVNNAKRFLEDTAAKLTAELIDQEESNLPVIDVIKKFW